MSNQRPPTEEEAKVETLLKTATKNFGDVQKKIDELTKSIAPGLEPGSVRNRKNFEIQIKIKNLKNDQNTLVAETQKKAYELTNDSSPEIQESAMKKVEAWSKSDIAELDREQVAKEDQNITEVQIRLLDKKEQLKANEEKKQNEKTEQTQQTKEEQKAQLVENMKKQWGMSLQINQELKNPEIPDNVQQKLKEQAENEKQEQLTKEEKRAKLVEEMKRQSKEMIQKLEP